MIHGFYAPNADDFVERVSTLIILGHYNRVVDMLLDLKNETALANVSNMISRAIESIQFDGKSCEVHRLAANIACSLLVAKGMTDILVNIQNLYLPNEVVYLLEIELMNHIVFTQNLLHELKIQLERESQIKGFSYNISQTNHELAYGILAVIGEFIRHNGSGKLRPNTRLN